MSAIRSSPSSPPTPSSPSTPSPPSTSSVPSSSSSASAAAEPRVGVVVITRNRRERLLGTLDRLAALPERPPVAVVDNGSTDGTARAVRDRHPQVRLLTPRRNLGAVGRNVGAAALHTPYVAFADDDSWWEPGALDRAAALFDGHPRLGLIAAAVRVGREGRPDPLNEVLAASPLGRASDLPGPSVLGFLACAAVVRREAFLGAGGFDRVLHFGGEEELLALELATRGWGLAHCPQVIAWHDPDPGPRAGRSARMLRNELLTAWMRRPLPRAASRTWSLLRACPRDPEARDALAGAVRRLPAAVSRRRVVPPWVEHGVRILEGGRSQRERRTAHSPQERRTANDEPDAGRPPESAAPCPSPAAPPPEPPPLNPSPHPHPHPHLNPSPPAGGAADERPSRTSIAALHTLRATSTEAGGELP
ncbi:glycosyltransferase [Streptomyces sp. MST-110588]|uniref:glycosyltransferase family 2 protein n=1 Tax=Streptomyces sp. MST-110588 TaxID=2833628 RepID=UPI00204CA9F2|nr:glycosyltransferase [Streptomyces sp. MST-110588]